jgi:hypothetical protein
MTTRATRPIAALAIGSAIALLTACSKPQEAPKPSPTVAAVRMTPAPVPQAAFQVSRIDLGTAVGADKKVAAPTTTFKPGDTIYASVQSTGAAPSVALAAKWTYQDGQTVNESTQTIAPTGPAVTEFHIAKPDGWPAGKYKLEVTASGKPAGTVEFTVAE